jgi:hypothetical protein
MGIDYKKSLSVAEPKQHLTNAANSLPYEAKEETIVSLNTVFNRYPNQAYHTRELSKTGSSMRAQR